MRKHFFNLAIIFFSIGILFSGIQTITGYYADPSGYGFHHIRGGYFGISLAVTLLGGITMTFILKRFRRIMW